MTTTIERVREEIGDRLGGSGSSMGEQAAWRGLTLVAGVVSAMVARRLVAAIWSRFKEGEVTDPGDPAVSWGNALQWAVASGVGVGVARVVAQRAAASAWQSATGAAPPGGGAEPALDR